MVTLDRYLAFVTVTVMLALIPGPDTMLSLRYAMRGRRLGWLAATGSSLAILVWAGLAAGGVAALLRTSVIAFTALTVIGGLYLVWLGVRAARSVPAMASAATSVSRDQAESAPSRPVTAGSGRSAFLAGIGTDLTNPKTGLFFLALFPQFTPETDNPLYVTGVLGVTVAVIIYAYLIGVVLIADGANRWLARPRVARALELATAVVMMAIGIVTLGEALIHLAGT